MAHQVQWTTNLTIAGGPAVSLPGGVVVDAYDHIQVLVKKGQKSAAVPLPGEAGQVRLVLLRASSDQLTYTVSDAKSAAAASAKGAAAAPAAPAVPTALDASQLLAGGAVSLLGTPPISLTFDNSGGTQDATVEVLVGRNTA